jgi:hypothetical protein
MAEVKINTGEAYHEDRLAESPREKWAAIISERRYYLKTNIDYDCRCLVQYVAEAEEFYAELGYDSAESMILEAYDIQPEQAWAAVAYLSGRTSPEPVGLTEAALLSHGGDRRSEQARQDQDYNVSLKQQGNSADYIKARLRRDHPEIAEQLEQGEFKSARQAGIAAGFVKNVPAIRLVDDINVIAQKLCQHLNPEQRRALAEALLQ